MTKSNPNLVTFYQNQVGDKCWHLKNKPLVKYSLGRLIMIKEVQCMNGYGMGFDYNFIETETNLCNGGWIMSMSWSIIGVPRLKV